MGEPQVVLPAPMRRRLAVLAAQVLGELTPTTCPPSLRRVREFSPKRRAVAGAEPLLAALTTDGGFRAQVALRWQAERPDVAARLDSGPSELSSETDLGSATELACGFFVLRPPGWDVAVDELRHRLETVELAEIAEGASEWAVADDARARAQAQRTSAELEQYRSQVLELNGQLEHLRRELRRHRADADRARAEARTVRLGAEATVAQIRSQLVVAESAAAVAATTAEAAVVQLDLLRRAARQSRSLDDVRVRLLLDTVVEAASGLRRELALPPLDQLELRPADLVAPAVAVTSLQSGVSGAPDDVRLLIELLALPRTHLVVDGYNVTKTGYPTLALIEQRRRLVESLIALAARTGAEITCCFDGAQVASASASLIRGVRVVFSAPESSADDLVREIVRAEPAGRSVVVVSSDREVVAGVMAGGARTVGSVALLAALARG